MRKVFLTAAAILLLLSNVKSQTKDPIAMGKKLGLGAEFVFPISDFKQSHDYGYGGSLQFQMPISSKLTFLAVVSYLQFKTKDLSASLYPAPGAAPSPIPADFSVVPLKIGAHYFFTAQFYAGGELGVAMQTTSPHKASFTYAPHVGVEFPVSSSSAIDFSVRYESMSKIHGAYVYKSPLNSIGLRLAYNFGF